MRKKNHFLLLSAAMITLAIFTMTANADEDDDDDDERNKRCRDPEITEVQVDANPTETDSLANFSIFGNCLGSDKLSVALAQGQMGMFTELTITEQDEYKIAAYLPALDSEPPLAGDYLLKLQKCSKRKCYEKDDWDLTIESDAGLNGVYVKTSTQQETWSGNQRKTLRVNCDGTDIPIGGGCELVNAVGWAAQLVPFKNHPAMKNNGDYNGWVCGWRKPGSNYGGGERDVTHTHRTWVICASSSAPLREKD